MNFLNSIALLVVFFASAVTFALPPEDLLKNLPGIIESSYYSPEKYEDLPPETVGDWTKDEYVVCLKDVSRLPLQFYGVKYFSNGIKVTGIVGVPKSFDISKKYPVVLYNRGGNRDFGREFACTLSWINLLFGSDGNNVILIPNYRGSGGGEGSDEFGGADVDDAVTLFKSALKLPQIDSKNSYVVGTSRGGMMTYLLNRRIKFNAAVVVSGPTDLELLESERPNFTTIFAALIPGYLTDRVRVLRERSAIRWPSELMSPTFIAHGTADKAITLQHATTMASKLDEIGKPHKLVIYDGGNHCLINRQFELQKDIATWFTANHVD